jgi:hypothetical protein
VAPRSLEVPGEGKMAMEVDTSWITNACTMCGAVLGAGLGFWWRDVNGAVFAAVLGILVSYALSKPNLDTTGSP